MQFITEIMALQFICWKVQCFTPHSSGLKRGSAAHGAFSARFLAAPFSISQFKASGCSGCVTVLCSRLEWNSTFIISIWRSVSSWGNYGAVMKSNIWCGERLAENGILIQHLKEDEWRKSEQLKQLILCRVKSTHTNLDIPLFLPANMHTECA